MKSFYSINKYTKSVNQLMIDILTKESENINSTSIPIILIITILVINNLYLLRTISIMNGEIYSLKYDIKDISKEKKVEDSLLSSHVSEIDDNYERLNDFVSDLEEDLKSIYDKVENHDVFMRDSLQEIEHEFHSIVNILQKENKKISSECDDMKACMYQLIRFIRLKKCPETFHRTEVLLSGLDKYFK